MKEGKLGGFTDHFHINIYLTPGMKQQKITKNKRPRPKGRGVEKHPAFTPQTAEYQTRNTRPGTSP
nr:hypothetical protein [Candidatus Electrothrix aestuarii]